jgi:1-acyl-sn-glycerol-3-phosphate acyltransferase
MGVLDVPLLLFELLDKRDLLLRSLGDRLHYETLPAVWGNLVTAFGVVQATPESCAELMQAGESILVFPGGAREVCKRKNEKYELIWKERTGFARMAIENRYPIIPVSAVGAEDCFDILVDANDIMKTPLRGPMERLGVREDLIPPVVRGVGLSMWPRPERFYFRFGEPIETAGYEGRGDDPEALAAVRDETKAALEEGIEWILAEREQDPDRGLVARLRRRFWPFRG